VLDVWNTYGYLKAHKNAKNQVSGHQRVAHGRAYRERGRAPKCREFAHGRATWAHDRASLTVQKFRFFHFRRFAHKILIR